MSQIDEGYVGPCKTDRAELRYPVAVETTFKELSDAALVAIQAAEYGALDASETEKVVAASQNAESVVSPNGDLIYTVDPDFADTDEYVDLRVMVLQDQSGNYVPVGGSYCARIITPKPAEVAS